MAYPSMNASYVSPHSKHPLFSFPVPLECASLVFQLFRIRSSRALHPLFFFLPRWIYYYLLQGKNMRLVFRSRIGSCEKIVDIAWHHRKRTNYVSFSKRQLKICWPLSFFLKKRKTISKLWSRDNLIISVCHKHVTGITIICLPSRLSRDCHVSRAENQNRKMAAGLGLAEVILDLFSDFSVNKAIEIKKITLFWWQKSEKELKTNAFER